MRRGQKNPHVWGWGNGFFIYTITLGYVGVYHLLIRIIARLLIIISNDNNKSLKYAVLPAANM